MISIANKVVGGLETSPRKAQVLAFVHAPRIDCWRVGRILGALILHLVLGLDLIEKCSVGTDDLPRGI